MPNILEQAAGVDYEVSPTVTPVDPEGGVLRYRVVDSTPMGEIICRFPVATRAAEVAILEFCEEHRTGSFPFRLPDLGVGAGQLIDAVIVGPPEIRAIPRTNTRSISVRLRRTTLTD